MARYGQKFKDAVVARLLPPESASLEAVSQKVGISVATLARWRAAALAANDGNGSPRQWTPAARLEAVIATAAMDEAARSAWCREHGLFPSDLEHWKQDALGGLGEPRDEGAAEAKQDQAAKRTDATQSGQPARRRVKELERDLSRKDKALAETAALLVLSKKLSAIFRDGEDA
jgi:transposase-like protein